MQLSLVSQNLPTVTSPFKLRDYQLLCIVEVIKMWRIGKRAPLLYAPTGSGKTAMACHIMNNAIKKGHKILFIVHRDVLVEQTTKALRVYGIDAGYIKAGYEQTDGSHKVIVASIQTLARRQFPENIGLVIVDEAHTVAFYDTYEQLKLHYSNGVPSISKVRFLGLTGSPWRTKANEYMGQHFDAIVRAPSPSELVEMGYLSPPRHFGWGGLADWSKLGTGSDGDFNQKQAAEFTINSEFNQIIVDKFVEVCPERTGICFAQSVEQSKLLTKLFNEAGITTEHLEADTPHNIRRGMYERLRNGETRIFSSVGTLTEGFDVPNISAVILGRVTQSLSLLIQMSGRGLRLAPDKKDCLLLDFCENFKRLGFITKKHKISLCTRSRFENSNSIKECPACQTLMYTFVMVCPKCGHEFPHSHEEDSEGSFLPDFGEMLSPEDLAKATYLRTQIKTSFTRGLNPDRVWQLFRKKYGYLPPNDWHLGAVFRGHNSEFHRNQYREFLYAINPKATESWVKFHLELEFGSPKKQYRTKSGKTFTPPPADTKRLEWWSVLGISSFDDWNIIKGAYRHLALLWHPDVSDEDEVTATNKMQLVNWAFEEAQKARGER